MRPLARELLAGREDSPVRLVYGTATATNTVRVDGETTAVVMPALTPVASGQRAAVLKSGGDRLIIGPVGAAAASGVYALNGSSVPSGASTDVPLVAVSDPLGWLDGGGNVVPAIAGMYRISFAVEWPNAAYTTTFARIRLNGSGTAHPSSYMPNVTANPQTNLVVAFVGCNGTTDSIDVVVSQDSGVGRIPNSSVVGVELLPGH